MSTWEDHIEIEYSERREVMVCGRSYHMLEQHAHDGKKIVYDKLNTVEASEPFYVSPAMKEKIADILDILKHVKVTHTGLTCTITEDDIYG